MIVFRRVSGRSMLPVLAPGQIIIAVTKPRYSVGDIVIVRLAEREVIKRIAGMTKETAWLEGDNAMSSTDSRHYGAVEKRAILGVMKYALPVSQPAPQLRYKHGVLLGWIAAVIMIGFAVLHVFRIDTFVPELQKVLGGNRIVTLWVGSMIVSAEVFAVPFLLRMRLSTLAQYVSGALGVAVPLWWSLVAIWTYGTSTSTAQLGEFKDMPSTGLLIAANVAWLLFAYFTLWSLGYDHRKGEKQSFVTRWFSRLSGTK